MTEKERREVLKQDLITRIRSEKDAAQRVVYYTELEAIWQREEQEQRDENGR